MIEKKLSKRDVQFSRTAIKAAPDVIHRTSPETGQPMEHIGDNAYRDPKTGEVYRAQGSVSNQSKQDTLYAPMAYPLSA